MVYPSLGPEKVDQPTGVGGLAVLGALEPDPDVDATPPDPARSQTATTSAACLINGLNETRLHTVTGIGLGDQQVARNVGRRQISSSPLNWPVERCRARTYVARPD
jgi:hypothetical protein